MTLKSNNQRIIHENYAKKYGDRTKWTRAHVEEYVANAVHFAAKLAPNDPKKLRIIKSLPKTCSVRYEWFESVIAETDMDLRPMMYVPTDYYAGLYDFLADWLDSVDGTLDRRLIIMRSCLMSCEKIGQNVGMSRQRVSRRFAKALDNMVWYLNHSDKYKMKK